VATYIYLTIIWAAATAWGLFKCRHDYRARGRLTIFGFLSVLFMFFMPHLVLDHAMDYGALRTPLDFIGLGLSILGWGLSLVACLNFRSARKVFCLHPGRLTVHGLYRISRNPQYVFWFIGLIGFVLLGWTIECLLGLGLFLIMLHPFVLIEEAHLRETFGEEYIAYCRNVPRYLGWGRVGI
jgi:protein-S-isoprenylcysteine O-methyltransferase Ste14